MSKNVSSVNHFAHENHRIPNRQTERTLWIQSSSWNDTLSMEFIYHFSLSPSRCSCLVQMKFYILAEAISHVVTSCAVVRLCHSCFLHSACVYECVSVCFDLFVSSFGFWSLMFPTVSIVTGNVQSHCLCLFGQTKCEDKQTGRANHGDTWRTRERERERDDFMHHEADLNIFTALGNWNVNYFSRELFEK